MNFIINKSMYLSENPVISFDLNKVNVYIQIGSIKHANF